MPGQLPGRGDCQSSGYGTNLAQMKMQIIGAMNGRKKMQGHLRRGSVPRASGPPGCRSPEPLSGNRDNPPAFPMTRKGLLKAMSFPDCFKRAGEG